MVEKFVTALESSSDVQEVVVNVTSPSPPVSPGYSKISAFTADNVVDQLFKEPV